jgi:ABC transporter substrate binding protein
VTRREFITRLGGAAAACPLAARAQQTEQVRRIGVLTSDAEDDPEVKARLAAFRQGLERLGWSLDRNVRIDYRFAANNLDRYQSLAKELVRLQPDVLLAHATPLAAALKRESHTIPIVFVSASDPIGSGLVASLARPGGNLTGLLLRGRHHKEVAGDAQGDRAGLVARRAHRQSKEGSIRLLRAIGQVRSAVTGNRVGPHSGGECRRYRACNSVLRT